MFDLGLGLRDVEQNRHRSDMNGINWFEVKMNMQRMANIVLSIGTGLGIFCMYHKHKLKLQVRHRLERTEHRARDRHFRSTST